MTRPTNTTATYYKEDEETRRMMGSIGLGLGLGLRMGMELEEEVEQVKEDPDPAGETQMMNEMQFIFEFPGQEEENTHNTTVEHETHSPSSEYLLPMPLSSSFPFHSDPSTLQLGSYNMGDAHTPASTSTFHDHTHLLSSTSSVVTAAVSACLPPLRPGSPTTEAMRSMMSVFRVDPFASYDIDAGSRRKRRKRGSSYAMLSDPEQTSREEPLMFTFQIDGMQDNEYVNFDRLGPTSAMIDGSLSIPSSPSMNLLSSYSSTLPNYNTFLHSETDDLSTMVLHSSEETATTTTMTTAGGGGGSTAFDNLYPGYTPSSRHHQTFHDINMISTMQRYSHHPHHGSSSNLSSNSTSNQNSSHSLSSTGYILQNTQQNACFNLDLGLGMNMNAMNVNMNTTGLGTSFPGTNTRVPIPGASQLSTGSVPTMNIGLSDTDVNVNDDNIPPMNSLSASITDLRGMIGHHFAEGGGGSNVWPSSHLQGPSYSHSSHNHSPPQPRYHRRHHQHQTRHTHTPQSQNRGFGSRFIDGEEEEQPLIYPLDLNLNKISGIHGVAAQSIPMPQQEYEPENKYQTDPTLGRDDEHQNGDDNRGNVHESDDCEPQEIQSNQSQIIEYNLSLGNLHAEDAQGINPNLESRTLTRVGQLRYPPTSSEDGEENENDKDGRQNIYEDEGEQKDEEVVNSDHVSPESVPREERQRPETKKRKREHDNSRWCEDRVVEVHDRDYTIISSSSPPTGPTNSVGTYRAYTTSGLDFNSFPLSSNFDTEVDRVDDELNRNSGDLDDHAREQYEYFSEHHEQIDIDLERPTGPEISVTSRPDAPSSAWTEPGGPLLLPAPSSAAGPEHGHGCDDKQENTENNEGLGFGSRDVGSSSLGLELDFDLGPAWSGPGMKPCRNIRPGLLSASGRQCLNETATTSDFTSSPQNPSSAVSSAESPNTLASSHHQIQLPKLHPHYQLQGSIHHLDHYLDDTDNHSVVTRQVYTSQSSLSPASLNISSASEPSISLNVFSPHLNMNTHLSSSTTCGSGPGASKMHICWICHKEFPRPSGLATHMNTHSGLKPYKCPIAECSKSFAVRSNARRHLRIHGTETGSGVYCDANEGSGSSVIGTDRSFSPYKYHHGRERSLSPLTKILSRQNGSQRYLESRREEAYSHHRNSYDPSHSYLSLQESHQNAISESRLSSPSTLNHDSSTYTSEGGGGIGISNFYDYYIEEYSHGVGKIEELEDSVPSISGIEKQSTPRDITVISPELLLSRDNFQATSDTRPSSSSSMSSSSTSSGSSMHTPISSTLEDPNVSAIPSSISQPSDSLKPHMETCLSRISVEMEMMINPDSPSTSTPTEALISMPIPQGPKLDSSMLLYF